MNKAFLLKILLYAYATSTFSLGIVEPVYAFFVQKLGGGILETAWSIALFSIVTGIVTIGIYKTSWSHRYRKEFLVWGWFVWLISLLMYCCMTTVPLLFVSQVLGAFGSALSTAAFDAEYAEIADNQLTAWALFEGYTSIASGVASLGAGIVVYHYGLQILMISMAAVAAISFVLIFYYGYMCDRGIKQ